jgi:CHAT domain-containing protein
LHDELIAPIADLLSAPQTSFSPASSLAGVPFAALGVEGRPLIEKTVVFMTPAPGLHGMLDQRRRSLNRSLIVGVADDAAPRIGDEASTIAAIHPDSKLLLDGEATIATITTSIEEFDLLHLACHGVHRNDNPWFHRLRLGDGWITAREITRWKLDGQLVVLSACDSGRQRGVQTANELFGLPYAFLAAGASAVLVNLWPADDGASEILMVAFHRLLAEGVPGAVALRDAQLMVRPQLKFPVHWANAVLIGSPNHRKSQP